jgi:hypothetical protein
VNIQQTERMMQAVPMARRLTSGQPSSPIRRAAKEVSMAFLELMRYREVATSKECASCHQRKSVSDFVIFRKKRADGTPYDYPASHCKPCKAAAARKREAERTTPPRKKMPRNGAVIRPAKVARSTQELAVQIADAAGTQRIQVISVSGHVSWQRAGARMPEGAELIGTYDAGSDRRDIYADLCA